MRSFYACGFKRGQCNAEAGELFFAYHFSLVLFYYKTPACCHTGGHHVGPKLGSTDVVMGIDGRLRACLCFFLAQSKMQAADVQLSQNIVILWC